MEGQNSGNTHGKERDDGVTKITCTITTSRGSRDTTHHQYSASFVALPGPVPSVQPLGETSLAAQAWFLSDRLLSHIEVSITSWAVLGLELHVGGQVILDSGKSSSRGSRKTYHEICLLKRRPIEVELVPLGFLVAVVAPGALDVVAGVDGGAVVGLAALDLARTLGAVDHGRLKRELGQEADLCRKPTKPC